MVGVILLGGLDGVFVGAFVGVLVETFIDLPILVFFQLSVFPLSGLFRLFCPKKVLILFPCVFTKLVGGEMKGLGIPI